jgi:hypothetical protein
MSVAKVVVRVVVAVLFCNACARRQSPVPAESSTKSSVPPAMGPSASPSAVSSTTGTELRSPVEVVQRWNAALNARDLALLRELYAPHVEFYGTELSRDAVLERKESALRDAPDFQQSAMRLQVQQLTPVDADVKFTKTWSMKGQRQAAEAMLELERSGAGYWITGETDAPSEARRLRTWTACEDAVVEAVATTEAARSLLEGPVAPEHGHRSNGLRLGAKPPESVGYEVAVHETHSTHLATLAWFTVDPKTGTMRQTMPEQRVVAGAPKRVARVRLACAPR